MKKTLFFLLITLLIGLISVKAQTVQLLQWTPENEIVASWGPSPYAPSIKANNITTSGLERGSGISAPTTTAGGRWGGTEFAIADQSLEKAIFENEFVTFTIKADNGYKVSLSQIDPCNFYRNSAGVTSVQYQYSIDGVNFTNFGPSITLSGTAGGGVVQAAIDLTAISDLQNVDASKTITFRVAAWGATTVAGSWAFLNANIAAITKTYGIKGKVEDAPVEDQWVSIGAGTATTTSIPFNFYYNSSAVQSIYNASEIGLGGGLIKKINYSYNSTATAALSNKPVRIYMVNTDLVDMTGGFLPLANFTLVYDGVLNVPIGTSEIILDLTAPFVYTGSNICVFTVRPMDVTYLNNVGALVSTVTPISRTRQYYSDTQEFNGTQAGSLLSTVPNIKMLFNTSGAGSISGTVTTGGSTPVEGAKLTLTPHGITTKSLANGNFNFTYAPAATYTMLATATGYYDVTENNIAVTVSQNTVRNVALAALPTYSVTAIVKNQAGTANVEGALVKIVGHANYETTTDANGVFFLPTVFKSNNYTITITKPMHFFAYTNTFNVGDANVDLGIINMQTDLTIYPYTTKNTGATIRFSDLVNLTEFEKTVIFQDGVYHLRQQLTISKKDKLIVDQNITVKIYPTFGIELLDSSYFSVTPPTQATFVCSEPGVYYGVMRFGEGSYVNLNKATFSYGSGMSVIDCNIQMDACTMNNHLNTGTTSGAISMTRGKGIFKNSTFKDNLYPAFSSAANIGCTFEITNCYLENNSSLNTNRPQINVGPCRTGEITKIVGNTVKGNRTLLMVGGISTSSLLGTPTQYLIEGNNVFDNRYGITLTGTNITSTIKGNTLANNNCQNLPDSGGSGINITASAGANHSVITENIIHGHLWGITLVGNTTNFSAGPTCNLGNISVPENDPAYNIGKNVFYNNKNGGVRYDLYNNNLHNIMAQNNMWGVGAQVADSIAIVIVDKADDVRYGTVTYLPALQPTPSNPPTNLTGNLVGTNANFTWVKPLYENRVTQSNGIAGTEFYGGMHTGVRYAGMMIPQAQVAAFAGMKIVKVAAATSTGGINCTGYAISMGGALTILSTATIGNSLFNELTLPTPVDLITTQDVYFTVRCSGSATVNRQFLRYDTKGTGEAGKTNIWSANGLTGWTDIDDTKTLCIYFVVQDAKTGTQYKLYADGTKVAEGISTTSYTLPGVSAAKTYHVTATDVDMSESVASNTVTLAPFQAPTAFTGTYNSGTYTANVSWNFPQPGTILMNEKFDTDPLTRGWTHINGNADANIWYWNNTSNNVPNSPCMTNVSYTTVAVTPNDWLITPQITGLTGVTRLQWLVSPQDAAYPAEKYSVYVSTTGTQVADFGTPLFTEVPTGTMAGGVVRTLDLSAFAGQSIYIAFRHYECSDQFRLNIDDVKVTTNYNAANAASAFALYENNVKVVTIANPDARTYAYRIPKSGTHTYAVSAISSTGTVESVLSNTWSPGAVQVEEGPCLPPYDLAATPPAIASVDLTWKDPMQSLLIKKRHAGTASNLISGAYTFAAGTGWTPAEMANWGMGAQLKAIRYYIGGTVTRVGVSVYSGVTGSNPAAANSQYYLNLTAAAYVNGAGWKEYPLPTPITIDQSKQFSIAYQQPTTVALVFDGAPTTDAPNLSNMLGYTSGTTLTTQLAPSGNYGSVFTPPAPEGNNLIEAVIGFNYVAKSGEIEYKEFIVGSDGSIRDYETPEFVPQTKEEAITGKQAQLTANVSPIEQPDLAIESRNAGFDIYRNDVKINASPILTYNYSDVPPAIGPYQYRASINYTDLCGVVHGAPITVEFGNIKVLNLTSSLAGRVITLNWTDVVKPASFIKYNVYLAGNLIANPSANTFAYVGEFGTYSFQVSAVYNFGSGEYETAKASTSITLTNQYAMPLNLNGAQVGNAAELTWDVPTGACAPQTITWCNGSEIKGSVGFGTGTGSFRTAHLYSQANRNTLSSNTVFNKVKSISFYLSDNGVTKQPDSCVVYLANGTGIAQIWAGSRIKFTPQWNAWNTVTFPTPVAFTASWDMYAGYIMYNCNGYIAAYDDTPLVGGSNGMWAGSATTGVTTGTYGCWMIKVDLLNDSSTPTAGVLGYNVLRNGVNIGTPTGTTFTDNASPLGLNNYWVNAKYAAGESNWAKKDINILTAFSVTFDANEGIGTMIPQIYYQGIPQALTANTFTRPAHSFKNWNTAADGTGTTYSNQQSITIAADITLYAQWANVGTITTNVFPMGAGTVTGAGTYDIGTIISLTATPVLPGLVFEKWTDGNTTNPRSITINGNASYTAQFAEQINIGGPGTTTTTSQVVPFNFYYECGAAQTIYLASELTAMVGKPLTAILYQYASTVAMNNKPVSIWIAPTALTIFPTPTAGSYIPENQFTKVFEGNVSVPIGRFDLVLNFQTPYLYTGGNIIIMTRRMMASPLGWASVLAYQFTGTNRVQHYQSDTQEFAFTGTPTRISTVPNIRFFTGSSADNTGVITGVVSSLGVPQAGATVTLVGTSKVSTTNAAGVYSFIYVPVGTYEVTATKFGYFDKTETGIVVGDRLTTVRDITLTELPKVTVSGKVKASDTDAGLEGAVVKLAGFQAYEATTNATGDYSIPGVYADKTYTVNITHPRFYPYNGDLVVAGVNATLNVTLNEIPKPTYGVTATDITTAAKIDWKDPSTAQPKSYILDDGSSENGWAINPSANAWIGNWFKTTDAGIIKSVDIYGQVNVASGPRTVTVDIFNAAQVLVGSSAPFTIPADQWINVPLPDVAYTGDFYAMVQWPATVNNTNYIGFDQTGPNANLNLDMYRTAAGAWSVLHIAASSAAGVMMIRTNAELTSGKGAEYGYANVGKVSNAEVTTFDGYASNQSSKFSEPTSQEPPSSKSIMGYNVYRGLETAPVGTWAKLNGATISGITYNDTNFPTLPQGVYKYGVEVIYTGNNLSPWALSNTLPKDMISNVTINVTTNLPGTDANGATVVMAHEDGLAIHRYNGVIAGGTVNFPTVWKGNYTITITKAVFDVINANVLVTNATHTFTYQLLEKLNVPTGLVLTQLARTDYNLKWTDIAAPIVNIEDNFEAHTAFTINSASTKGWSYIDGDGSTTYGFSGITFPGGMTPMAYIIFKPSATTPDMNATAGIQPFSGQQFNACFAADVVMPNNDWFISPELSFAGQFTFSFYAKTYMSDYGLERFKVRYSTTGNAQANFTNYLAGTASTWVEAPVAAWTKYTYTVPSTAKYVAIQCVSNDAFVFMIDDIFIGTAGKDDPKAFLSYNVYLDGTKVSTAQVQSEYNYLNVPVGAHVAGVSHNYTTGESALATINFRVYPDAYCFSPRNLVITQAFAGNTLNWQLETNAYSTDIGGAVYNVYKDGVMIAPGLTTLTYFDACNSYAPATYTVERVCTGGVICPVPVTTTVANRMLTVPAYEPFSAATPANWINVRTAGTGTGTFQFLTAGTTPPATPKAGTHLASYNCYSYSAGTQGILVTPYIDGMKAGTIIDFWVYRDGTNYLTDADLLRIHANNRNDLTGATLLGTINRSISLAPVVAATGWYQYQFTAPADGRNFFIIEGRSAYGNNLHFDEITIFNYVDVIATAGPNGAIAPAGTTTIVQGTNMTLTATPDAGYHVSSILVNGEPFTFNKNPESSAPVAFTLNNIRVNTTVHVEFELNYYTLNPNNIIGAGATLTLNPDPVYHGGNATINIAVDCHTITGVIINGVNLGAITTYNFNNVVEPLPVIEIVTTIISYNILATPPQGQQVGGYITPAGVVPVDCGSAQTFTIVRNPGYRPNALWVDGVRVNIPANRKYTFTDVRAPHTINVEFEVFPQVLIYFSSNEGGRVIADDFETAVGFISLDSGTVAQRFTIVPDANYEIHAVYVDGVLNVSASVSGQYVFTNIIVNHTITAEFKKKNFTITATSGINGTITPSGLVSVPAYNNKLFIFNPATGYIIDKVLVDNVANVQAVADGQYEFTNVTANHTIAVTYKKDTYYIVAQCGLGGTITPQGNIPVLYNEHHAFTFAANVGYKVAVLTIDGVSHPELIALGAYTFYYVTTGHTIYVTFEKITYPVTASAGANGYISDPGTIYVPHGNNKSYSFTAANGYKIDKVYVDGVANAGAATTGLYTFSNVTAAHTISVSFIADAYTIVSSATAGGTISPVGNVVVANGANRTFSFNATPGNRLVKVKVDGIENAPAMVDGYYTFINVTANHTIEAIFAPIPVYSINATATTGGTITPAGNIQVTEGGTANFTFAAATFNKLTKVLVDGLEDALALQNGYFTFTNVFANHTIQAVFQSTITINENDYSSFIVSSERNVITITNKDLVPVEQVDIMDMFGRVIWAGNISDITTNITLQVATGVYAVRIITTDNVVLTTKVQILN